MQNKFPCECYTIIYILKELISIVMLYLLKLEIIWAIRYICDKLIWPDNISQPICRTTCRQHIFLIKPIIPGFSASDLKLKHSNLRWVMNATEIAQVLSDTCLWLYLYPWRHETHLDGHVRWQPCLSHFNVNGWRLSPERLYVCHRYRQPFTKRSCSKSFHDIFVMCCHNMSGEVTTNRLLKVCH